MEIKPATLDQLVKGRDGKTFVIESDVGNVAAQLKEINDGLKLEFNESGEYFVVSQVFKRGDGSTREKMVLTAQECDGRIVERVKQIGSDSYDFAAEAERMDKAADKQIHDNFIEKIGAGAEHLAHALRKDLGIERDAARSRKSWGKG